MSLLFSKGEYILADSGYASLDHIVPTFKRSSLNPLTPAQNHFNNALSKLRVASEHCNGMLKGRFGSLKELRLMISDAKSAGHVCAWISACVVLHNFMIVERFTQDAGFKVFDEVLREDDPSEKAKMTAERQSVLGQRQTSLFNDFVLHHGY